MKHLERRTVSTLFFTAYFHYGRLRYGRQTGGKDRLPRLHACRDIVKLCFPFLKSGGDIDTRRFENAWRRMEDAAATLPDAEYRRTYLATLARFRRRVDVSGGENGK